MRIGVDVGGTNTDAVLMAGAAVVSSIKAPITADVGAGVVAAIDGVLKQSAVAPGIITGVMIGTTQFTSAIIERRRRARQHRDHRGGGDPTRLPAGQVSPSTICRWVLRSRRLAYSLGWPDAARNGPGANVGVDRVLGL